MKNSSKSIIYIICFTFSTILDRSLLCNNFILVTPLYNEVNDIRSQEFITCLEKNQDHRMIKKIHVVYDTSKDGKTNKILNYLKEKNIPISFIDHRATYGDCFKVINKLYANQSIILSNADIYFNETLNKLDSYNLSNKFLALTRWNVEKDGTLNLHWLYDSAKKLRLDWAEYSQDVWIFSAPLKAFNDDIGIGTWHCDSRIAYEASLSGLTVLNPCLTIQCCHLHLSEIRNYNKIQISGKFLNIPWSILRCKHADQEKSYSLHHSRPKRGTAISSTL